MFLAKHKIVGVVFVVAALGLPWAVAARQKVDVLRIGTTGALATEKQTDKEKSALVSLKGFIKEVTGYNNDITRETDWKELTDKLTSGERHIGVYQGYEFAWATKDHPDLKPLALAINLYRYPTVHVVTNKDNPAAGFADLKGQALVLPDSGQPFLRLFAQREARAQGKELSDFFAKIITQANVEDCIDDVVDGTVQAAVIDRAALEAFKQRKPGRFKKLKELAKSPPMPPLVVAYFGSSLDDAELKNLQDQLLKAGKTEKGRILLNLFHMTDFNVVGDDFEGILAETRKQFPAPQ
jgi:ABC-type phosphate/phosphonate transport system substrate-binding protein